MGETLKFQANAPDAFTSALTEAGWLGGPVEAACMVRQGHSPSMTMAFLGVGLLKLLTPRAAKELPRTFVLAVAADRVAAFDAGAHSRGEAARATYHVVVDSDELASWPRDRVTMAAARKGITSNAILHLPGAEVAVTVPNGRAEEAFDALVGALGGSSQQNA